MSGKEGLLGLKPEEFESDVQMIAVMSDNVTSDVSEPDTSAIMQGLTNILETYSENVSMMSDYKEALKNATTLMFSAGGLIKTADETVISK